MDDSLSQEVAQLAAEADAPALRALLRGYEERGGGGVEVAVEALQRAGELLHLMQRLHKLLCSAFARRFADLRLLVPDFATYARAARHLAQHATLDGADFRDMLTQQQVVALSLGLSGELGPPVAAPAFAAGCALQIELCALRAELLRATAGAAKRFAPNLCALIGGERAAELVALAGGVPQLAATPACNIKMLGSRKAALQGFSSRSSANYQGALYGCELVQEAAPEFRDATFRDLANKVALAARVDAGGSAADGRYGERIRAEIKERLEKKMNNRTPKYVRPLPVPGLEDRKPSRGGRQKRANKLKFGLGEELTNRQKVAFGVGGQFDEVGVQYGKTALESFRKKKAKVDTAYQQKIDKKLKAIEKAKK